ncbi:RagB/SusD family nutrient uptake outer membrane protein [Spirosoma endbachense]|uniref:RagB/SusD family nutrient uptake outer membrane protein n=1 Tax=Spirosoma endbachense TaxID=2666025 RepID=A0A6P1W376_9BACT|nr:RagB/SusD family nutrient uptake outer membrane protein [Spirosoma endbachense]QHV99881.1 RagB/SusD family nutrient uptake outer membrane protein [Spirosoma endbachense]
MKRFFNLYFILGLALFAVACTEDLLDQVPTTQLSSDLFWKTTDDAIFAVNGVYDANRTTFDRDYYFDGGGEFVHTRGTSNNQGVFNPGAIGSNTNFGFLWGDCYRTINRANYVLGNIGALRASLKTPSDLALMDRLVAETRFLRAINYFRLIDLWGDVPYFTSKLNGNTEAYSLIRTPRAVVKDSILADLAYAATVLPETYTGDNLGRASKLAAWAFSGKVRLFWACWMKNEGKTADAQAHYTAAAADFKKIIDKNIPLFRNGEPGPVDNPNYWHLFQYFNEYDPEIIFSVQFGGPLLAQGEEMQRDFGTRNTGNGQVWVAPTFRLANRYQLLSTGDFAPSLVLSKNTTQLNSATNPKSYAGRDYRMRATILWDEQKMLRLSTDGLTVGDSMPFRFGSRDGVTFINYDGAPAGYIFRKWIRQTGGIGRSDGPQDMYMMRLPDVWLMYAEAINETNGGPTSELFTLLNRIRRRGNLPALNQAKFAAKADFFKAIEQERIVELVGEGHRFFDIRRWKKAEEIWPSPGGQVLYDSQGTRVRDEFVNAPERDYQRYYLFQIPPGEIEVNSKIIQNTPWL